MPSEAVERVLARLWALDCNARGNETTGWTAKCPAHDDRSPSFKLDQADDGRALVYCHTGCTIDQIASSMSLDVRELFEPEPESIDKIVVERYDYTDQHGVMLFQVERLSPKGFRQRKPDGRGDWSYSLGSTRRVLYRLPAVIEAVKAGQRIYLVEGERDVHTLESKGKVATTMPGGAGKWRKEYTETLRGAREVAIIQDVDELDPKTGHRPGQEHAEMVRQKLEGVVQAVRVFQPAVGKDITDHIKAGMGVGAIVPAGESRPHARLEIKPARAIMEEPELGEEGFLLGPLVYKGHRIVVGGWTGHGKTTFTMHMVSAAVNGKEFLRPLWKGRKDRDRPVTALVIDVEQGTKTVKRVLRETGLDHSDRVQYLRVPDGLALDSDPEAIEFLEKAFAKNHFDIVLADPLYKLHRGDPNDTKAATELMRRFDDWRERYSFALILPMHCRKPQGDRGPKLSPHDLFGSSAYQWGAEMLLGVERKSQTKTWIHWWKDREGEAAEQGAIVGSHWDIAFDRKTGFGRYVENHQERLPIVAQPSPRFDLGDFCYQQIRDTGAVTRDDIKSRLHAKGIRWAGGMPAIDKALENQGHRGVISNGAHLKKDRVYQLQPELLTAESPAEAGLDTSSPTRASEEGGAL